MTIAERTPTVAPRGSTTVSSLRKIFRIVWIRTWKPTTNMIKEVTRLDKSSIFQWPNRWSRSAGWRAMRMPMRRATLLIISDKLLKPSATKLEEWRRCPVANLAGKESGRRQYWSGLHVRLVLNYFVIDSLITPPDFCRFPPKRKTWIVVDEEIFVLLKPLL